MKLTSLLFPLATVLGLTGCGVAEYEYSHTTHYPRSSTTIGVHTHTPAPAPIIVTRPVVKKKEVIVVDSGHQARRDLRRANRRIARRDAEIAAIAHDKRKAERRVKRRNAEIADLSHDLHKAEKQKRDESRLRKAQGKALAGKIVDLEEDKYKLKKKLRKEKRKAKENKF